MLDGILEIYHFIPLHLKVKMIAKEKPNENLKLNPDQSK